MIISAPSDYRKAVERRLPRFLFDYIDGGAVTERTMTQNVEELASINLRQRVLTGVGTPSLETQIFAQKWALPIALGPVGATGTYARRGEVQAARAASAAGIPYTLSTASICSIEEVSRGANGQLWSQLYVLKDRGYMRNALERAWAAGMETLVFTVDLPVPGSRYRDRRSGMSGPAAWLRQRIQAVMHPHWALDVGLLGRPLSLGNIAAYTGRSMSMNDYAGFIGSNFDPTISWKELEWIRDSWKGKVLLKGVIDPEDARDALRLVDQIAARGVDEEGGRLHRGDGIGIDQILGLGMVDQQSPGKVSDHCLALGKLAAVELELDEPAEFDHPLRHGFDLVPGDDAAREHLHAQAANAGSSEAIDLGIGGAHVEHGHAACGWSQRSDRG